MSRWTIIGSLLAILAATPTTRADWPFFSSKGGPHWGSKEYYEMHANDPPGGRQVYKFGKIWPPQPRPVGPSQTFIHKYHHAHYWPHPYLCQDREAVAAFVNTQVSNGWLEQTTLHDYHFDPVTNELNSSGRVHLHWIVSSVPAEHQQVSIALSRDPEKNSLRTANVQREIAQLAGANPGIQIAMRTTQPVGRPAAEVQSIFTSAQENMPPPILSKTAGETGSGNNTQ